MEIDKDIGAGLGWLHIIDNLAGALIEDILEMPDDELMREAIAELGSHAAAMDEAERISLLIGNAVERANTQHLPSTAQPNSGEGE